MENKLNLYIRIFQNNIEPLAIFNLEDKIIDMNPAFEKLFGYSKEELIGKEFPGHFGIDDGIFSMWIEQCKKGIGIESFETTRRKKDGSEVSVSMSISPIFDLKNELTALSISYRDITKIKEKEDELINSEIEKSTILNNQTDCIVLQDLNNKILWANKVVLDYVNMSLDEIKQLRCFDIWGNGISPCDMCSIEKAKKTGVNEVLERIDSNGRIWLVKGTPILDKNNKISRILEVAEDITNMKEIERRIALNELQYRTLVNSAPVGILVTSKEEPIYANPKGLEIIGVKNLEELLKKKLSEYIHEDDLNYAIKMTGKFNKENSKPISFNLRINGKKSTVKYVTVTLSSFSIQNDYYLQIVFIDNTYIEEIIKRQKELAVESIYLNEKNKLIEELSLKYERIADKYDITEKDRSVYKKILDNYFQPEKDWNVTKAHFEAVHSDFFSTLKSKYPKLTQNELRHCAYIRMNYTTKEIARIFLSLQAVYKKQELD